VLRKVVCQLHIAQSENVAPTYGAPCVFSFPCASWIVDDLHDRDSKRFQQLIPFSRDFVLSADGYSDVYDDFEE